MSSSASASPSAEPVAPAAVRKITPVLIVERMEPSVAFWRDRLGLQVVAEVPHGDHVGFAILAGEGVELMYQSRESVLADVPPEMAPPPDAPTYLFVEVADLDAVERSLAGVPHVMPRRTTFYGMTELAVREPGGHVVTFAMQVGE